MRRVALYAVMIALAIAAEMALIWFGEKLYQ